MRCRSLSVLSQQSCGISHLVPYIFVLLSCICSFLHYCIIREGFSERKIPENNERKFVMLKKLFCCIAVLALAFSVYAAPKKENTKDQKTTKKERKAAKKNAKKRITPPAIPGLPPSASNWKKGPNKSWEIDFSIAVDKAKKSGKRILVLASGSDWCPPCMKLKSTVLNNSKFRKVADESFVLVFLDFPKKTKLPATQKTHNMMVAKKFPFGTNVPSALVIDPVSMKSVGQISGYKPAKKYVEEISKFAK